LRISSPPVRLRSHRVMLQPPFLTTGIGSLPHRDPEAAVDLVLATTPEAPAWPQLPALGIRERMDVQFSEGIPGLQVCSDSGRLMVDTATVQLDDITAFYVASTWEMLADEVLGVDSCTAISQGYAQGIYALESRLKQERSKRPFVKVQTIGPCTFGLVVTDARQRPICCNKAFWDDVRKALAMKCRWQIRKFKPYAEQVICFIDEPSLACVGDAPRQVLEREEVVAEIKHLVDVIHSEGALAGVHCCGDADWEAFIDAGADILSIDAYGYGESIGKCAKAIESYLQRGGVISWGIVPTSVVIREQTAGKLVERFERAVDQLAGRGVDKELILGQAMLTPSCGAGCLEIADAEKVLRMLRPVAEQLRGKHRV
jgi:hypothetical protein